ncbi:MAG: signal peptide peptidase SppA [Alphaproteobacteria bacterium]
MRRFVLGLFAAIGVATILAILAVGSLAWYLIERRPALPDSIVLTADLNRALAAGPSQDSLSAIVFGERPTLRDFLDAIERAGDDPRVKALYVQLGQDGMALATSQEIRDAVQAFRAKGKFAVAFSESFGEFGPGTRPYYLAAAFDEIWVQPLGSVGLIGLRAEVPFFRGTLDWLGIKPVFDRREEYKTAANSLTETAMTGPQREEIEALLTSMSGQIAHGIAASRRLPETEVRELIDRGPLLADEAKAAGLIDRIGYRDDALAAARGRAGSGARMMPLSRYVDAAGRVHASGPKIALIYGTGLIMQGSADDDLLPGGETMSAGTVARAFRDAARDPDVRAILFRVDSPGGSAVASETIWREVSRARGRGKPVIVSMGDVAGSGGYYIAAPADKIVAQPATLTGSIGVLAGKLVVTGLLDRLGANSEAVQRGANAAMFSPFADFSPAARARLDAFLDATYRGFKERVAAGRHMSADQVEAVAKGRVWSGEQAKERGLVDALGGYDVALRLAKEAASIPADAAYELAVFPRPRGALERIVSRVAGRDGEPEAPSALQTIAVRLAALRATLGAVLDRAGVLRMPPVGEIR